MSVGCCKVRRYAVPSIQYTAQNTRPEPPKCRPKFVRRQAQMTAALHSLGRLHRPNQEKIDVKQFFFQRFFGVLCLGFPQSHFARVWRSIPDMQPSKLNVVSSNLITRFHFHLCSL